LTSVPLDVEQLELADIVVIETAHSNLDWSLVGRHAQVIVDTRNVMAGVNGTRCSVVKL
jgi:UDP-N-acetyl-D-glucosamine dehydrogenase